jgi:plasmid stabilization system protein ParE
MAKKVMIVWSLPAIADLDEIADYIAVDNEPAAKRLVERVIAAVDRLGEFPNMGRKVPELPRLPYRELIVAPCRVIYRIEGATAFIVLIARGEKLLEEHQLWRWKDN